MPPDLRLAQHHCPAAGGKHRAPVKTVGLRGVQHLGGYARRAANGWKRLQKPTKSRDSIRKNRENHKVSHLATRTGFLSPGVIL